MRRSKSERINALSFLRLSGEGIEATQKYKRLLAYFVLGGLQGLQRCEMIRERAKDPVIEWRDFLWKKRLIVVRAEVAKQTRARDKLRYVPLEPTTIELLKPLATTGEVIPVVDSSFYRMRQNLCKEMRVRWPENCLRNSYATYAQTFRSSGDAMRDLCRDALYFPYRTINILFFSFSSQLVIAVAT